jgi:hypothetical protein
LRDWVESATAALLADHPIGHRRLCQVLAPSTLTLELDSEVVSFASDGRRIVVGERPSGDVRIACASKTFFQLLEGEESVSESARRGALRVEGSPQALESVASVLSCALHCAVRSPSLKGVLERFRTSRARLAC